MTEIYTYLEYLCTFYILFDLAAIKLHLLYNDQKKKLSSRFYARFIIIPATFYSHKSQHTRLYTGLLPSLPLLSGKKNESKINKLWPPQGSLSRSCLLYKYSTSLYLRSKYIIALTTPSLFQPFTRTSR